MKKLIPLLLLTGLLCGCSPRGAHMPKHRKKRHCDCPTFSEFKIQNSEFNIENS